MYCLKRRNILTEEPWEVADPDGETVFLFAYADKDKAESLADTLNEAYERGFCEGCSYADEMYSQVGCGCNRGDEDELEIDSGDESDGDRTSYEVADF